MAEVLSPTFREEHAFLQAQEIEFEIMPRELEAECADGPQIIWGGFPSLLL